MDNSRILAYREKLEQVVDKYGDFFGEEANGLCDEYSIPEAKKLQADLAAIADEERLLKIGIVGRVNSGKSSLLNALLFEGQSVLPKAATPMTAALAVLSHGDAVQAEVEFFTPDDIEDIKAKAGEYERQLKKRTDALLEEIKKKSKSAKSKKSPQDRAQSQAARDMRDNHHVLASSYEQYEKMKDSRISVGGLGESELLNLSGDLSALQGQLADYVGADGPYMPFTKSVNIRLPQENLKDLEIVDTPGLNDPVASREARTNELLSQCDVVFVVSQAGQFMNKVDENLLDRITSKEGIRELYVVAVQVDTQLYGSEKEKNDGQLDRVLDSITEVLGSHLKKVIADLKENNPEVGNTYDQLLDGQSRIIHSSSICASLKQRFGEKDEWDEDMEHVWNRLQKDYRDYFPAADEHLSSISLDKLSNISAIQSIVEQVRVRKEDIRKEKIDNYVHAKRQSLQALRAGLLSFAEERQGKIEKTELETIKKQKETLETDLSNASKDIGLNYEESIEKVSKDLKKMAQTELETMLQSIEDQIGENREKITEKIEEKEEGLGAWFKRLLGLGGTRTRTKTHVTIRTNAVSHKLSRISRELSNVLINSAEEKKKKWRDELVGSVTKVLRESFDDDDLDALMIRRVIRHTVNSIPIPKFEYEKPLPKSLQSQGVLEQEKAEEFISAAENHLNSLEAKLADRVNEYAAELAREMKKVRLAELLLKRFQEELAALEESIGNKEMELKRISLIKGELERMED